MIFGRRSSTSEAEEQWKALNGLKPTCLKTMRQSFHRALTTCKAPLPPGKKYVAVQFLTKERIFYVIDAKGKGQEVFEEASKHLGISDSELFGLAFYQDGDYIFIDLNSKVSKYAARNWKTNNNGVGVDGQPLLILHMRIKYYVDCHLLISEKVVRHHYYLQLRENVSSYSQALSEEKAFLLAALALQADLGNYDDAKFKDCYFEMKHYFPSWVVSKVSEDFIVQNIPALHKDNFGLSRGEAQVSYIKEASDNTAPHNLHFYKMRRKKGKTWNFVWLGIRDGGLHIYEHLDHENVKSLLSTFLWCDIAKLHFEKKKFEILSEGIPDYRRFTYFVQSEELSKHLLWICRMTHHFHMANQARVADLKKLELEGGKPYREAYIYTDKMDQAWEMTQNSSLHQKRKVDNGTINFNGAMENSSIEKNFKPMNMKMSGIPWSNDSSLENGRTEGQYIPQHHSMEVLPLSNTYNFSPEIKYKSQSISCFSDRSLAPSTTSTGNSSSSKSEWNNALAAKNNSLMSPSSTLISRSSRASNTDSNCSSLSLASSSLLKLGNSVSSKISNDANHWVKCDSFEELPIKEPQLETTLQKICISTFNKHIRTASVYDAITTSKMHVSKPHLHTSEINLSSSVQNQCMPGEIARSTNKRIEVKRSPSLNVCSINSVNFQLKNTPAMSESNVSNGLAKSIAQRCRIMGSAKNAQNQNVSSHARTTTRIGVSSLSRDQRLPLTLFDNRCIMACGSEPNLYAPLEYRPHICNPSNTLCTNSRSEMCLNAVGCDGLVQNCCNSCSRKLSLPDMCSDPVIVDSEDFPCIPPPPAYRNDAECSLNLQKDASSESSLQSLEDKKLAESVKVTQLLESHPGVHSSPPDILDIHQLRQKSRDLDLPLISALCNDRSLLMLPKTVPTCSRQRHLGNKDHSRFGRATSLPSGDSADMLPSGCSRPISWHIDSESSPKWMPNFSKPCSSSWDDGTSTPKGITVLHQVKKVALPSTILTSFGKTPTKGIRTTANHSSPVESYRSNKSQMIPTKLLAGSGGGAVNGRLYHKGLSS